MYQPLPKVGFVEAIKRCIKNFANFDGRIRRSEYWWFVLFLFLCNFFVFILSVVFGDIKDKYDDYGDKYYEIDPNPVFKVILYIMWVIEILPHLSAAVRRLHDTGKSGCFYWIVFVPLAGIFILIVLLCIDSVMEQNIYGPCPKYDITNNTNGPVNYQIYQIPVQPYVQNNQQIYNPPQYNNNTNQVPPYQVVQPNPQGYVPPNYTSPTTKNE